MTSSKIEKQNKLKNSNLPESQVQIIVYFFIFGGIMFLLVCGIEKNVVGASLMPAIASTPQLAVTVIGKSDVQIQLNYPLR